MKTNSIDIVCMQETRRKKTDTFHTDCGFWVLLSGHGEEEREWAGVGCIVAEIFQNMVIGFNPFSNRDACLKLRVAGRFLQFARHMLLTT